MSKLPTNCPSCQQLLQVSELTCEHCHTVISGNYALPAFMKLQPDDQQFLLDFIISGGSLKKMAAQLDKSYPTVRNKLDDIIAELESTLGT